jgi:hypothetical protein
MNHFAHIYIPLVMYHEIVIRVFKPNVTVLHVIVHSHTSITCIQCKRWPDLEPAIMTSRKRIRNAALHAKHAARICTMTFLEDVILNLVPFEAVPQVHHSSGHDDDIHNITKNPMLYHPSSNFALNECKLAL